MGTGTCYPNLQYVQCRRLLRKARLLSFYLSVVVVQCNPLPDAYPSTTINPLLSSSFVCYLILSSPAIRIISTKQCNNQKKDDSSVVHVVIPVNPCTRLVINRATNVFANIGFRFAHSFVGFVHICTLYNSNLWERCECK